MRSARYEVDGLVKTCIRVMAPCVILLENKDHENRMSHPSLRNEHTSHTVPLGNQVRGSSITRLGMH